MDETLLSADVLWVFWRVKSMI